MKKIMMKYLMISCKDATMLTAKKEEGRLTFGEGVKLRLHSSMCSLCKKFEKQSKQIAQESKDVVALDSELTEAAKKRMEDMLKNFSSN